MRKGMQQRVLAEMHAKQEIERRNRRSRKISNSFIVASILYMIGLLIIVGFSSWKQHSSIAREQASAVAIIGAISEPPSFLLINGERWTVFTRDLNRDGAMAETDCYDRMILWDPNSMKGSSVNFRDSMMHEIFHAGDCIHGNDDRWWNNQAKTGVTLTDHVGIERSASFMVDFMRTNPDFVAWLTDRTGTR